MKFLLILLILAADGAAYYEYQLGQQHATDYRQRLPQLIGRIGDLTKDQQKLTDENTRLTQNLSVALGKASDLSQQIHTLPPSSPATGSVAAH